MLPLIGRPAAAGCTGCTAYPTPVTRLWRSVSEPSDQIVEVLIKCMEWNIMTRRRSIPESELPEVHKAAVDLLEVLKKNLPDKSGEESGWNFEKAHSILHKVREIVLWGNSDNTSCQGRACSYRTNQVSGTPYQQQGCFLMHLAIPHSSGLPPTLRASAGRAGRLA